MIRVILVIATLLGLSACGMGGMVGGAVGGAVGTAVDVVL